MSIRKLAASIIAIALMALTAGCGDLYPGSCPLEQARAGVCAPDGLSVTVNAFSVTPQTGTFDVAFNAPNSWTGRGHGYWNEFRVLFLEQSKSKNTYKWNASVAPDSEYQENHFTGHYTPGPDGKPIYDKIFVALVDVNNADRVQTQFSAAPGNEIPVDTLDRAVITSRTNGMSTDIPANLKG